MRFSNHLFVCGTVELTSAIIDLIYGVYLAWWILLVLAIFTFTASYIYYKKEKKNESN